MGYYTTFHLECSLDEDTLTNALEEICPDYFPNDSGEELLGGYFEAKWYDFESHMKILSKKYPNNLFTLYGHGEDSDDRWVAYFRNGKMQFENVKIIYEDFDPEKLT